MVAFLNGDLVIGGAHGYLDHMRVVSGTPTHIQEIDAKDDLGNRMRVNGLTFSPQRVLFAALGDPAGLKDFDPHDVVWMPNGSGVLTLLARTNNTAVLRLYDKTTHTTLRTWTGLTVDAGWTPARYLKMDIMCDSRTVFYTDRGKKIRRFDLEAASGAGAMLSDFADLGAAPYIQGALKIIRRTRDVIVAQTASGNGPLNGVALDPHNKHWVDEINPPSGVYHITQRDNTTHLPTGLQYTVRLTPTLSSEITSLACCFSPCVSPFGFTTVIS